MGCQPLGQAIIGKRHLEKLAAAAVAVQCTANHGVDAAA